MHKREQKAVEERQRHQKAEEAEATKGPLMIWKIGCDHILEPPISQFTPPVSILRMKQERLVFDAEFSAEGPQRIVIDDGSGLDEIRASFKRLALIYHPDKGDLTTPLFESPNPRVCP